MNKCVCLVAPALWEDLQDIHVRVFHSLPVISLAVLSFKVHKCPEV